MLLLLALIATAFPNGSSHSITRSQESDELFEALDKELDDFLASAIDDLPRKLEDAKLQRIEGSGDPDSVTETFKEYTEANTVLTSPNFNRAISEKSREELALSQMLSSIALAARMPLNPQLTSAVVERAIYEESDEELRNLIANMTTGTRQTSESLLTNELPLTSSPADEINATTSTTTLRKNHNASQVASATTAPSTTPLPITLLSSLAAGNAKRADIAANFNTFTGTIQNPDRCKEEATCYDDADCGQGRCLGVSLGRCNCHACIANVECLDDSDCGGLRTACRNGICRCAQALSTHGYTLFIDALTRFCSQKKCTETSDSCFGLPCSRGICSCT